MTQLIEEIVASNKSLVEKNEDFFFLHHQEKLLKEFWKVSNDFDCSLWFKYEKDLCNAIEEGKFKAYFERVWKQADMINSTVGVKVMAFMDYLLNDRKEDLFHHVSYDEIKNEREIILKMVKDNRTDLALRLNRLINYAIDQNLILDEENRYSYDHLLLFLNYINSL